MVELGDSPRQFIPFVLSFSSSNTNTLNDNNCCSYVLDVIKQMNMLSNDMLFELFLIMLMHSWICLAWLVSPPITAD